MVKKSTLTKTALERLVKHLVDLEDLQDQLVEGDDYTFIGKYTQQVEQLIEGIVPQEGADDSLPFIIIGSEVEVEDLDSREVLKLRVVNPFRNQVGNGCVSCFSPVGRSLLLKGVKDKVTVQAPGGIFHYEVRTIKVC